MRYQTVNHQLDEAMNENETLRKKLNNHNNSFIGSSDGGATRESVELLKANYERDEHKWNAEKLSLKAQVNELEQLIKTKDDEASLRVKRQEKSNQQEL